MSPGWPQLQHRAACDLRPALSANVRRNARAERDRPRRWRPARDALWSHVQPYLPAGARVAVVGAGNADDLPLTRLADRASHVALVDVDGAWPFKPDVTYLVCATTAPAPLRRIIEAMTLLAL